MSSPAERALSTPICRDGDSVLLLSHYPRRGEQGRHVHDHVQISFLLAGRIEERIGRRAFEPIAARACVKPAGTEHSDKWGRDGALMLSLRLPTLDPDGARIPIGCWTNADLGRVLLVLGSALAGEAREENGLLAPDLLACIGDEPPTRGAPPPWLERTREAASELDRFSAARAAQEAGVHRVHLSRAFAGHYGVPLSLYRQRVKVARALSDTIRRRDEPLAGIAHGAGYSDQSHMTRALKAATGATPAGLRRLFSAAPARSGPRR